MKKAPTISVEISFEEVEDVQSRGNRDPVWEEREFTGT